MEAESQTTPYRSTNGSTDPEIPGESPPSPTTLDYLECEVEKIRFFYGDPAKVRRYADAALVLLKQLREEQDE